MMTIERFLTEPREYERWSSYDEETRALLKQRAREEAEHLVKRYCPDVADVLVRVN